MAELAHGAVLVPTSSAALLLETLPSVDGPSTRAELSSVSATLNRYAHVGYQASHLAQAVDICREMLKPQTPSPAPPPLDASGHTSHSPTEETNATTPLVQPTLFVGATANLFGTGCREAIRFLCKECVELPTGVEPASPPEEGIREETDASIPSCASRALIHALVVSGGAMEHDIRRACEMYRIVSYASESASHPTHGTESEGVVWEGCFGNIAYGTKPHAKGFAHCPSNSAVSSNDTSSGHDIHSMSLFERVMSLLVQRLAAEQEKRRQAAFAKPIPEAYLDTCNWAFAPSSVWCLAGKWLPELFEEALQCMEREKCVNRHMNNNEGNNDHVTEQNEVEINTSWARERSSRGHAGCSFLATSSLSHEAQSRAESTVLYWAVRNEVPIFSPSFVDGDVMRFVMDTTDGSSLLKLDLVTDIHRINKLAMRSRRTGMIILGGGVVKHHVCNANLMRNGADFAVIINNGQEFDGSDAGARPDEAISWGKIRLDAQSVKVYAEVSLVLPLLVAHVFVPHVRAARELDKVGNKHNATTSSTGVN